MVEHSTADREVPGSNPGVPSTFWFELPWKRCIAYMKQISNASRHEKGEINRAYLLVDRKPTFHEPLLDIILHQRQPEARFWNNFQNVSYKHRWSSGRILACHAGDPGSIPGRCMCFCFFLCYQSLKLTAATGRWWWLCFSGDRL